MFSWPARVRRRYWMQMTLKGSCRTAQGASPGKKRTSSHLEKHPRSDPERVEQQMPGREPWRHGRPGCQPGKAEAACTALSGRTSGPATVPRACALGCPAGPLRGPFQFPDPVCFLTACDTILPQRSRWPQPGKATTPGNGTIGIGIGIAIAIGIDIVRQPGSISAEPGNPSLSLR